MFSGKGTARLTS
ncbi:hypothetical protein LINPERPRIM_LOCUS12404 [Linum perenne]